MSAQKKRFGIFRASWYVPSLDHVSIRRLHEQGISLLLIDRDNTCVPLGQKRVPFEIKRWFAEAKASGLRIWLISNNWHGSLVRQTAEDLGCRLIHHACKPLPRALKRAMAEEGVRPEETAMIGDQMFTDLVAGNLAGVHTILVDPQCTHDMWYTKILRGLERRMLKERNYDEVHLDTQRLVNADET